MSDEQIRAQLVKVTMVLCETRGHAGRRPCKFCTDMHLWMLHENFIPAPPLLSASNNEILAWFTQNYDAIRKALER
jgi:hypothetical protein